MRTVLFVIPAMFLAAQTGGGGERHLIRLASEFRKAGDSILIVAYKKGWFYPHHEQLQLDQHTWDMMVRPNPPIRVLGTGIFIFFTALYLLRHLFTPSIVILNSVYAYVMVIGCIARLMGKRTIAYTLIGDLNSLQNRTGILRDIHRQLIRQQNYVIPLSEEMNQVLEDETIPARNRLLIPNGIDTTAYKPVKNLEEQNQIRQKLNLPIDDRILVNVARFAPVKCDHLLLDAFALLQEQHHDLTLLLIGDGPCRAELKRRWNVSRSAPK